MRIYRKRIHMMQTKKTYAVRHLFANSFASKQAFHRLIIAHFAQIIKPVRIISTILIYFLQIRCPIAKAHAPVIKYLIRYLKRLWKCIQLFTLCTAVYFMSAPPAK